jgi:uncharacterized protein
MRLHRVLVCVFAASLAFAQAPAPSAAPDTDAPPKEQILKLIDLLRVRNQMKDVMTQLREQVHTGALENLRGRTMKPTPQQMAAVNQSVDEQLDEMERKYTLDRMIEDIIPVYQRHLTRGDLESMITFYSSSSGQKILDELPAMMQETMQVASSHMQPIVEAALDNVDKKIQELTAKEASNDPDHPPVKKKPAAAPKKPTPKP